MKAYVCFGSVMFHSHNTEGVTKVKLLRIPMVNKTDWDASQMGRVTQLHHAAKMEANPQPIAQHAQELHCQTHCSPPLSWNVALNKSLVPLLMVPQ